LALERKPTIPTHNTNTFASETPVTDGERIYASFGMHGVFCYDLAGNLIWKQDLPAFPMMGGWGTGSSPTLVDDKLIIQSDNEKQSYIAALNKLTGKEVWRVERDAKSSWSTPYIWKNGGRSDIVACGGNKITAYSPADGKVVWELGGISGSCSATPVAGDGMLFVGAGGRMGTSPLFAVKDGVTGDITLKAGETSNAGVVWSRTKSGPSMASPLYYQGYLYIIDQNGGMISCYDGKTGEPAYYRKRISEAGSFSSSPWAADGKIFCLDEAGQTAIIKAGPDFVELGKNKIPEMTKATPALVDGTLYLRTIDHLYSIK